MSFVTDTQAPAVLFPGQGSQTPEMRDHVARLAPDLLERVTELVGEDPFARVEESTRFAQPAIFCASITAYDALGLEPGVAAGHSLGELAALAAAGVLDRDDALELVVLRGRLMAEADDTGSMLALVGATEEEAREIAAHAGVTVANDNAPGQVVLSGTREALALAEEDARDHGRRALKLNVAGAFHSPLMEPAVAPFTRGARRTTSDRRAPLPGRLLRDHQAVRGRPRRARRRADQPGPLARDDARPQQAGCTRYVEVGPGKVLARLGKRILTDGPKVETPSLEPANA